jgi:hypothetical protein
MAVNKLKPPTRTYPAWVAFAVVYPALLVALLSCPLWISAYGAKRLMKVLRRSANSRGFVFFSRVRTQRPPSPNGEYSRRIATH